MMSSLETVSVNPWVDRYQQVRAWSEKICEPLCREDYVPQPISDVSPPKWHLGHTTWFFETFILQKNTPDYQPFQASLDWFFNSYYESQGPRILRSNRGNMTRPDVETVLQYRAYVDEQLIHWLTDLKSEPMSPRITRVLEIGLHHEQQHQELLVTDLKYILGTNPLYPVYRDPANATPSETVSGTITAAETVTAIARPMEFRAVPAGLYEIGHQGEGFCWDNELSAHPHYLQPYELGDRLVTNGEYLAFLEDGGYERFELWQMDGIEWIRDTAIATPLYWYQQDGDWYEFTLGGLQPLNLNLPVTHLSWYEADAYARWTKFRLPTEQEWETAARLWHPEGIAQGNYLEQGHLHPTVCQEPGDTQMAGHCWEWTNSAYLPYPRYPRLSGALGEYNGKFMINQMVLRGGSCATPASHLRISYRNFFQPDKRWQYTGIRLCRDASSDER